MLFSMGVTFYSQRLLNPFRGVMNIIELDQADAVTTDGVEWILYVHDETDCWEHQENQDAHIVTPDIRYGSWSARQGLKKFPLLSSMNIPYIKRAGRQLMQAVRELHARLPFPPADKYELWLLDKDNGLPLALLDSVCEESRIYQDYPRRDWLCGQRCQQQFRGTPQAPHRKQRNPGRLLARRVNRQAGEPRRLQWFWRNDDGKGFALQGLNLDESLLNRQLERDAFPPLLLATGWPSSGGIDLVYDFLAWQAPWLLLLPDLDDELRLQLEHEARSQATLTASLCHLYPRIIDHYLLNAIRIEAQLRGKEENREETEEETLQIFVNE